MTLSDIYCKSFLRQTGLMLAMMTGLGTAGWPVNSGNGLPHTRAAWVMGEGHLTAMSYARFWGQTARQNYEPFGEPGDRNVFSLQNGLALNYGISRYWELQFTPVLYQTDQNTSGQFVHDMNLSLILGSLQWPSKALQMGGQASLNIPTGTTHNLLFEEYSIGAYAIKLSALASFAVDAEFPNDAPNFHINLHYHIHNDVGEMLSGNYLDPESHILERSQSFAYAAGVMVPGDIFDYGAECYGLSWQKRPPPAAEGREDYLYGSLFLRYKPLRWLNFSFSGDYRISDDVDDTVPSLADRGLEELPNYNTWRINLGVQMAILPLRLMRTTTRELFINRANDRKQLFEQIIDDGGRRTDSKGDLQRMREERNRAEMELERLRKILESRQQNEQKPKKENQQPD